MQTTLQPQERNETIVRLSRLLNDVACQRNALCRKAMNDTDWVQFDLLDDFCDEQSAFLDNFSGMTWFDRMFLN